jgi:hypothetical protein
MKGILLWKQRNINSWIGWILVLTSIKLHSRNLLSSLNLPPAKKSLLDAGILFIFQTLRLNLKILGL